MNNIIQNYNLQVHDSDLYNSFISLENLLVIENNNYKHTFKITYFDLTINLNYFTKLQNIDKIFLNNIIKRIILIKLLVKKQML